MDQEVAKTLGELELKLQELEHELTSLGHHDAPVHQPDTRHEQANAPGKLIDEAVEHNLRRESDTQQPATAQAISANDSFGGPAMWGGEEVPAQAGATNQRDWTAEIRETAYGEIPIPPPQTPDVSHATWPPTQASQRAPSSSPTPAASQPVPHHPYAATPTERQSVDIADLVEFKEKMQRTLDELIAEYSRLLSPKPPA